MAPVISKPRPAAASAKPIPGKAAVAPLAAVATANGLSGTVTVNRTYKDGAIVTSEESSTETLETVRFLSATANVGVSTAFTRNLGDYNSVKVSVMVNLPCYVAEVEDAYVTASNLSGTYLHREIDSVRESFPEFFTEPGEATEGDVLEEGEGEEEAVKGEGEEDTAAYIQGLDRAALEELIDVNSEEWSKLGLDTPDYTDTKAFPKKGNAGTEKLTAAVLEVVLAAEKAENGEVVEEVTEVAEEEAVGYTEEDLKASSIEDLKAIFEAWELGTFPPGPPALAKKKAIAAILEAQAPAEV